MEILKTVLALIISLSSVLTIFTGIVNKLFSAKLKPIEDKIDNEHVDSLKKDLQTYRYNVVSFASDLRRGTVKSRFEYDAIFSFINMYEEGVEELQIKNNLFTSEVEYIKKKYNELEGKDSK